MGKRDAGAGEICGIDNCFSFISLLRAARSCTGQVSRVSQAPENLSIPGRSCSICTRKSSKGEGRMRLLLHNKAILQTPVQDPHSFESF